MKIKNIIIGLALVLIGFETAAQQLPESNLYTFNKYNINPAYTGYNGCFELYGSHLSQWVGFDGTPRTNYFSAHAGLGKNMGLGGGLILDRASFVSRFSGKLSYAYRVKLGDDHNLRFGLSAGVFQVKVDATQAIVDDVTDEVVSGGAQSGMNFDSDFGIFYNLKGLQIGFSIPQVFETQAKLQFQGVDGFTTRRHYIGYASYDWELNESWSIEPSVLYKTAASGLNQLDVNGMVTFKEMISIGAGYRTNSGLLARLGIQIKDLVFLGYAYEFPGASVSSYTGGSHEIMLGIKFCKNRDEDVVEKIEEEKVEAAELTDEEVKEKLTDQEGIAGQFIYKKLKSDDEFLEYEIYDEDGNLIKRGTADEFGMFYEPGLSKDGKYLFKLLNNEDEEVRLRLLNEDQVDLVLLDKNDESYFVYDRLSDDTEETLVVEEEVEVEMEKVSEENNLFKETYAPEILFPYNDGDNYDLSDNDDLKDLAKYLKDNPNEKIVIEGHACNVGEAEDNMTISKLRAESVYQELKKLGVSDSQMRILAKGETEPKFKNSSEENRRKNRRVEIEFE